MNQLQSQEVEFMADIMIGIILIAAVGAVIWNCLLYTSDGADE